MQAIAICRYFWDLNRQENSVLLANKERQGIRNKQVEKGKQEEERIEVMKKADNPKAGKPGGELKKDKEDKSKQRRKTDE